MIFLKSLVCLPLPYKKKDRSIMNIPFISPSDELDAEFVKKAKSAGLKR